MIQHKCTYHSNTVDNTHTHHIDYHSDFHIDFYIDLDVFVRVLILSFFYIISGHIVFSGILGVYVCLNEFILSIDS